MPRRKSVNFIRDIGVDSRFQSGVMQKFINVLMESGKKSVARSIVYEAFDILTAKNSGDDAKSYVLFEKALVQIKPVVEVKSRRVGGGVYQVPTEVKHERRVSLALRWIIDASRKRLNKDYHEFALKLASELIDASQNLGEAIRKRDLSIKQAEANKAFSHFRW